MLAVFFSDSEKICCKLDLLLYTDPAGTQQSTLNHGGFNHIVWDIAYEDYNTFVFTVQKQYDSNPYNEINVESKL